MVVGVLAIGPKFCGFKPGRGECIFKDDKNQQHPFLRRGSKAVGLMSKTLWHVKQPYEYERSNIRRPFFANFLLLCNYISLLVIAKQLWWVNQE
jgi:hypothetical protein